MTNGERRQGDCRVIGGTMSNSIRLFRGVSLRFLSCCAYGTKRGKPNWRSARSHLVWMCMPWGVCLVALVVVRPCNRPDTGRKRSSGKRQCHAVRRIFFCAVLLSMAVWGSGGAHWEPLCPWATPHGGGLRPDAVGDDVQTKVPGRVVEVRTKVVAQNFDQLLDEFLHQIKPPTDTSLLRKFASARGAKYCDEYVCLSAHIGSLQVKRVTCGHLPTMGFICSKLLLFVHQTTKVGWQLWIMFRQSESKYYHCLNIMFSLWLALLVNLAKRVTHLCKVSQT